MFRNKSKYLFLIIIIFLQTNVSTKNTSSLPNITNSFNNKTIVDFLTTSLNNETDTKLINKISEKDPDEFTDEELYKFISNTLNKLNIFFSNEKNTENVKTLESMKQFLVSKLKKYKIKGTSLSVAFDPNIAFVYSNANPDIKIKFKNKDGKFLSKTYQTSINSYGFNFGAAFFLDMIFITDSDLNFFNSKDKIELDSGISINIASSEMLMAPNIILGTWLINPIGFFLEWFFLKAITTLTLPGIGFTYAPFKAYKGGILVISIPLPILNIFFSGISKVTGGYLKAK